MTPAYITVTAPSGRRTPIHHEDGTEPGGGQLCVVAGEIIRVRYAGSQTIRRSIGRGDLIPCDMNGAAVGVALAASADELPGGRVIIAERLALKLGKVTP